MIMSHELSTRCWSSHIVCLCGLNDLFYPAGYVTCLLDESRVYAQHGKKKIIDLDDVKLAVTMQTDKVNTSAPPRDVLNIIISKYSVD
jgi:hypothetical protein